MYCYGCYAECFEMYLNGLLIVSITLRYCSWGSLPYSRVIVFVFMERCMKWLVHGSSWGSYDTPIVVQWRDNNVLRFFCFETGECINLHTGSKQHTLLYFHFSTYQLIYAILVHSFESSYVDENFSFLVNQVFVFRYTFDVCQCSHSLRIATGLLLIRSFVCDEY